MTRILKTIFSTLLIVGMAVQLSAQLCGYDPDNAYLDPNFFSEQTGAFNVNWHPDGMGQSLTMDAGCVQGTHFEEITILVVGNSAGIWDLEIYDGESTNPADLKYTQNGITHPPGNPNGLEHTINITGGTGDLTVVAGNTYTFLLKIAGGTPRLGGITGNPYPNGKAFFSAPHESAGQFHADADFLFHIGTATPPPPAGVCTNPGPSNPIQTLAQTVATGESFGQSFVAGSNCLTDQAFGSWAVRVNDTTPFTASVKIYEGTSVDPANEVYSEEGFNIAASSSAYPANIVFGTGTNASGFLTYTEGQTYTFIMTVTSGDTSVRYTGDTISGEAYFVNAFFPDRDLVGGIGGGTDPGPGIAAPVPTMGEWALITFGLIIMSIGVITVRRREEVLNAQAA